MHFAPNGIIQKYDSLTEPEVPGLFEVSDPPLLFYLKGEGECRILLNKVS